MGESLKSHRELILVAGVEGGGVSLYGERLDDGWRFSTEYGDQTPFMLADSDCQEAIRYEVPQSATWEEALGRLDHLGWLRLPAVMVHKEFRDKVWAAVQQRLTGDERNAAKLERWRDRCRQPK